MISAARFYCFLMLISCAGSPETNTNDMYVDVLVIGDGTGAISAAIQSARSGSITSLVTTIPWLGGMLTSAGVSAIDGNHHMPAGIWGELRSQLREHYGGADKLATGWISHSLFEPSIGDSIFKAMVTAEPNLKVLYNTHVSQIEKSDHGWTSRTDGDIVINSKILIDGTDLGDVFAEVGGSYDLGLDKGVEGPEADIDSRDLIQDLTFVSILKDYGEPQILDRPDDFDSYNFTCSCDSLCNIDSYQTHPCSTMMTYAKLPGNKYLINWPIHGNDYYANVVEIPKNNRAAIYSKAKDKTLAFVYYINHELGFENLALADDEFPTSDHLPFMPYHREGRRAHGLVRLEIEHILDPYATNLYRTGVAVGDYPIDHHHKVHNFEVEPFLPPIPSYNLPLGCLLPKDISDILLADKSISVSHIVNGTTRLQPVILQVGQACGIIAALSLAQDLPPSQLSIRTIQSEILKTDGYIMPTYDVGPEDPHFEAIQRISACGILKLTGEPYKWANRSWFYPDSIVHASELLKNIDGFIDGVESVNTTKLRIDEFAKAFKFEINAQIWQELNLGRYDPETLLTKRTCAVLLDHYFDPFKKEIDIHGDIKKQ